ncbi:nitrite reductase [bacterium]|nr:nitrite reductase [bacterium]MBU1984074.1 nitrite reductase [bacterium]
MPRIKKRWTSAYTWLALLILIVIIGATGRSHLINLVAVPWQNRPARIHFEVETVTDEEFERIAADLVKRYGPEKAGTYLGARVQSYEDGIGFDHVDRFRRAGIRSYEGPETCLACHQTVRVPDERRGWREESLKKNILSTVHFSFNVKRGFSTWGFNGEKVDKLPLGKIDRACGIPGSFTWTGWAALVQSKHGTVYSEGCGQCHIGGQYGPSTGTMLPGYTPTRAEFEAIDCLICHARDYDMNRKQVVRDPDGRLRWDQDRSMNALMSIQKPKAETCLRCHQHNHGGDFFVENEVAGALGYDHPRLLHHGAKRGNPWAKGYDVHADAGMQCIDCHVTAGHRIARGLMGTDLVGNDLPGVEVSCTKCHGGEPHSTGEFAAELNTHIEKLSCEACHIHELQPDNIVLRDWADPVYNEEEGLWTPRNVLISGDPKEAMTFRWFNGQGTFMAGGLGDNPNGQKLFRAVHTNPDPSYADFDYAAYYEEHFRPIAQMGTSRIYPFKRFNAQMFEDMNNQGPFGGMLLPFDYNVYYETGDPKAAVLKAVEHPLIQDMYGPVFKAYMMDKFMAYMAVDGWNTSFDPNKIEPRWMRQDATLMINHGIQKQGRSCNACHTRDGGLLDFRALGYPDDEAVSLATLME